MNINTGVVSGATSFGATRYTSTYSTERIIRLRIVGDQNMINPSILPQRWQVVVGSCVSVWGCIAGGVRGPLVMYPGKLNGGAYVKVIEEAFPGR